MRLHRLLAVLVIALFFNVAASKDAHAAFKCRELLEAHANNNIIYINSFQIFARAFYIGLEYGMNH